MAYALGIDLGTTFTAAAIARPDGRVEPFQLGERTATIPTVVVLRDDGEVLVGDAAERRSVTEPARTAREFKRRIGDPVPLVIGGTPYGAETLLAKVLEHVIERVTAEEGEAPARIAVTHPATWGAFKLDLLEQAIKEAGLDDVELVSEPEAAAIQYAHLERLEPGEIVAVYDFGGGTFDAAVLRASGDRFEVIGTPEGLGRLGGIDIDQAVLVHVDRAVGGQLAELDPADPATGAALARLRAACRDAKEALSSDTDATVPVALPGLQTEVRITRAELEAMVRPRLGETIATLQRALAGADVAIADVGRVLLVGGTSRIPLVGQTLREELGRPVAVDANPKLVVAFGAARWASRAAAGIEKPPVLTTPSPLVTAPPPAADVPAPQPTTAPARPRWLVPAAAAGVAVVVAVIAVVALGGGSGGGEERVASDDEREVTTTTEAREEPVSTTVTTEAVEAAVEDDLGFVSVVDDTASFSVELPDTFATNTTPIDLDGVPVAHISGSDDLAGYLAGNWSAAGATVLVASSADAGDLGSVIAAFDPGSECSVRSDATSYQSPIGSGLLQRFEGCGPDGGSSQLLAAVDVPAEGATVVVGVVGAGTLTQALFDVVMTSVSPI